MDGKELAGFDKKTGFFANAVGPLMKSPFEFTPARAMRKDGLLNLSQTR